MMKMKIDKQIIRKRLLKVFYRESVDEIMKILVDSDGVTQEDVIIRKNGKLMPGTSISASKKPKPFTLDKKSVSQKEHQWHRSTVDPPLGLAKRGGPNWYFCKCCGKEKYCSWAELPKVGCK